MKHLVNFHYTTSYCGLVDYCKQRKKFANNPQHDMVVMKVNQVFHYHSEKAQAVRTTLLFELYQTLLQLGTHNYQLISAA